MRRRPILLLGLVILAAATAVVIFRPASHPVPDAKTRWTTADESERVSPPPAQPPAQQAVAATSTVGDAPTRPRYSAVDPACTQRNDKEALIDCVGLAISKRFDSEGRDDTWADVTERTIMDGLIELSNVTVVTALTVECRETTRRLQMGFPTVSDVPTQGSRERDTALVSRVFDPIIQRAGLQPAIVPYPYKVDLPERTYYFGR
jgi:hypothetical protein